MPLTCILCGVGIALIKWSKMKRTGNSIVVGGILLLAAVSYAPVADSLLWPLESACPPYERGNGDPVGYVVVLGGGHVPDSRFPLSSQIGGASIKRLIEGVRIHRENTGSKLILSGGGWRSSNPETETLKSLALAMGVLESEIIVEPKSNDTADQARLVKDIVSTNRFVLVTSASHMPRAQALFEHQGMRLIPAPTDHIVMRSSIGPGTLFPSGGNLARTERAFYEYMGLAWIWVTGQI